MVLKPSSAAIPPMTSSVVRRPQHPQRFHPVELGVRGDLELGVLVDLEQEAVDLEVLVDLEPELVGLEVADLEPEVVAVLELVDLEPELELADLEPALESGELEDSEPELELGELEVEVEQAAQMWLNASVDHSRMFSVARQIRRFV